MPGQDITLTNYLFEMSILIGEFTFIVSLIIATYSYNKKKNIWWNIGIATLHGVILFVIINIIGLIQFCISKMYKYGEFFTRYILTTAFYLIPIFNKKANLKAKICISLSVYSMFFIAGELGSCFPVLLRELEYSKILDTVIRNALTVSTIIFSIYIRHFSLSKIKDIPVQSIIYICVISLLEIGICIYCSTFSFNPGFDFSVIKLLLFIFVEVINYLTYYMIFTICIKNENMVQLQAENFELTKNNELITVSDEYFKKLRAIKHDEKNQYSYMKILIEQKRYDELETFFNQYGDGTLEAISFISCNNPMISSILNMEYSKARAKNIEFDTKIAVPDKVSILSTDLSSLLTNVIDNAIEACTYHKIENPIVTIRIRQYEKFFLLEVSNPVSKELTLEDIKNNKTTKEDKAVHGFGYKIIRGIVSKYQGTLNRTCENGLFTLKAMLNYPDEESKEN